MRNWRPLPNLDPAGEGELPWHGMALVPGLNIGVGILVLIIIWIITVLAVIALAAVPKARFAKKSQIYLKLVVGVVISLLFFWRYGIPAVLLLSVVVTIVLLFYPRQSPDEAMMDTIQEASGERERDGGRMEKEREYQMTEGGNGRKIEILFHNIHGMYWYLQDVDEVFYGRLVLLLTLSLFLAGGGVALFFIQCTETIHAKEKRTFYITSWLTHNHWSLQLLYNNIIIMICHVYQFLCLYNVMMSVCVVCWGGIAKK